ncbi:MAG: bactofilin family protein [Bacteroidota bacterium]|uniref:Protein CcmA, bactofilin family n=1 Tax=Salegentibacter flavus TaxID=287099 RepID=A0A1I5A0R0_9FLAO|nr:polymer-forming cytoskeletal protein [Salegentibacter flavus]SFN56017.1 protein CcmA, bactofilin family [Salegentibacter flavus]
MFSDQKKSKSKSENTKEQNRIAAGTTIIGDISGKGGFRIEGTLDGNLKTAGKVVISEGGLLKGKLECEHADIEGKINGNLHVTGTLSLRTSAVIEGEVSAGKLAIEPGATFNATCQMNGDVKSLKQKDEKKSA